MRAEQTSTLGKLLLFQQLAWAKGLPRVVKTLALNDVDGDSEHRGQPIGCECLFLGTVRKDAAGAQQNDAIDFRNDVVQMMSDQQQAYAVPRQGAHVFSHLVERRQVQT